MFWCSNKKPWVTSVFCDWFQNCFVPEVETYVEKNNLDFNAVSDLDNAPSRTRELEAKHPNIKCKYFYFLLRRLCSNLNPGIIQAFALYYITRNFKIILDTMECDPDISVMQWCSGKNLK